ncbi:hypothetical protein ACJ6WF_03255 [Streptomyces sp. MMS24-I2-30]|uniref:hypothetical protein n=1 Tax=Streptomyces sp. MMS24-I2-30 TaxID=3351564 RepID=UPI003896EF1F
MSDPALSGTEIGVVFERVLSQALGSTQIVDALKRPGATLDRERLRARAAKARTAITAAAAVEYQDYLVARSADAGRGGPPEAAGLAAPSVSRTGGLLALFAVAVPGLSAVAAAVFLMSGYALRVVGGRPYVGDGLITVGLLAAAVAAGAAIGDLVWMLATAARNHPGGEPGSALADTGPEVAAARAAWELALLERGMVPFLLGRIEEARMRERGDHAVR